MSPNRTGRVHIKRWVRPGDEGEEDVEGVMETTEEAHILLQLEGTMSRSKMQRAHRQVMCVSERRLGFGCQPMSSAIISSQSPEMHPPTRGSHLRHLLSVPRMRGCALFISTYFENMYSLC